MWTSAFSTRTRPIWSTRSSSPSAGAGPRQLQVEAWPAEAPSARTRSPAARRPRPGRRSSGATASRPASSRDRSSRSVASFVKRVDLRAHLVQELLPRLRVELLAREQLEEAAEREERRAQLVRGVRDELAAGAVERGELQPHPLERPRQLRRARREPGRRPPRRTRPPAIRSTAVSSRRMRRANSVASRVPEHDREDDRERRPRRARACDDAHAAPRCQRGQEDDDRPARRERVGRLGEAPPPRVDLPCTVPAAPSARSATGSPARSATSPLFESANGSSSARTGDLKTTDAHVVATRRRLVLDPAPGESVAGQRAGTSPPQRPAQLASRCSIERAAVRRDDDHVDDRERARDDHEEREREPAADTSAAGSPVAEPVPDAAHGQDVLRAAAESASSFSRRWRTWTSIVRGSRKSALPQSASSSIRRLYTRPGCAARSRSSSNST